MINKKISGRYRSYNGWDNTKMPGGLISIVVTQKKHFLVGIAVLENSRSDMTYHDKNRSETYHEKFKHHKAGKLKSS